MSDYRGSWSRTAIRTKLNGSLFDLMRELWEKREEFVFEVEPIEKSITEAKSLGRDDGGEGPIMLIDHGDNCGSGGNQDVMAVLAEVIDRTWRMSVPDPSVIRRQWLN